MNKCIYAGRLTRDPEIKYSQGNEPMCIARYTLAIDRRKTKGNDNPGADFIPCVAFGKTGEFAEKYLKKGTKILVEGHTQSGSYEKDGQKRYTLDCVIEKHYFCEGRREDSAPADNDGFMNIPDGIDEELPFN